MAIKGLHGATMLSGTTVKQQTEQNTQPPSDTPAPAPTAAAPNAKQVIKEVLDGVISKVVTGGNDSKAPANPSEAEKAKLKEALTIAKDPKTLQALRPSTFDEKKLDTIEDILESIYPHTSNTSRTAAKAFIRNVKAAAAKSQNKEYMQRATAGAIHYVLLELQLESDGYSNGWVSLGMDMFQKHVWGSKEQRERLKNGLAVTFGIENIHNLPPQLEQYRLVCLAALEELPLRVAEFKFDNKTVQSIEAYKKLSYSKQIQLVGDLESRQPLESYLREQFLKFPSEYKTMVANDSTVSSWFNNNKKHQLLIAWLFELLDDQKLLNMLPMKSTDDKYEDQGRFYTARAALLFAKNRADANAYRTSRMSIAADKALNIHERRQIPKDIQDMHLTCLKGLVDQMITAHDVLEYIATKRFNKKPSEVKADEIRAIANDLKVLQRELFESLLVLNSNGASNNILNSRLGGYIARFGAGFLAGEALNYYCPALGTAKILTQTASVIGYVYFGVDGMRYFKYAGDFLTNQLIGGAEFISRAVIDTLAAGVSFGAGTAVAFAIRKTTEGLELIGFKVPAEQVKENHAHDQAWVDAVYPMAPAQTQERILRVAKVTDPFKHLKPADLEKLDEKVIEANRKFSAAIEAEHARRQKPTSVIPYTGKSWRCGPN